MKTNVNLTDAFFTRYRDLIRTEMIPYQWKVLNDEIDINIEKERNDDSIPNEKSHCIENFRIAAGKPGHHYGWVFQDSDLYKWLEAVAYSLRSSFDKGLKALADDVIDLIGEAQEEDGYLSTYFTIEAPDKKFKRLYESHEMYCAGHFFEAACAYYETTGNEKAILIARKLADYLDGYFGEGKHFGYDGHEEVEIGLAKLYELTGEIRYLNLASYFLEIRGTDTSFLERQRIEDGINEAIISGPGKVDNVYLQDYMPPISQSSAEGHAVRLVYMCEAMAHVAHLKGNKKMYEACRRIYENIVNKRMYITGGIGSTFHGERFTFDYDLPNNSMYCETCASIGLFHFMYRMLECEAKSDYADTMERALYNTILGGMALDGRHFFYVNPLEADPEAYRHDPGKSHVKPVRPEWLGCACCPPNLARCLTSLQEYIYVVKDGVIYVNLYIGNEAELSTQDGLVKVIQKTEYPRNGKVMLTIEGKAKIALRIPGWAEHYSICLGGEERSYLVKNGYAYIDCEDKETEIEVNFEMEPLRYYSNVNVRNNIGRVAIMRGPVVYCQEEADNGKDVLLSVLPKDAALKYSDDETVPGVIGTIRADGYSASSDNDGPLYSRRRDDDLKSSTLTFIPYYSWANRGEGRMQVWVREN